MGIGYIGSMSNVLAKSQETGVLERTLYKTQKPIYYEVKEEITTNKTELVEKAVVSQTTPTVIHDALVIDVRGLDFEPAQINRIYFNDQLIYDPLMVPAEIIAQRGLAKYTTTLNRAKAILESYGSSNPLVVKATKIAKLSSDVVVSQADAVKITKENINKGFLESARIVFIVE